MVDQVKDLDPRNQYTATSGQTIFPYTFPIFDKADLVVIQEGATLTEGTDYTVSGVGDEDGGNVTLTTGATTGDTITIYRDIALERLVDYQDSGDFLAADVNDDFDRQLFMIQQLNRDVQRALRVSQDDEIASTQIGDLNTRANKLLAFDASGEITYQASTTVSPLADALTDTVAAAKSSGLAIGDYVRTGGYTSFNGGGGALYRVVAGGTGTDDGGSYHDMSNGNQLELMHNNRDFYAANWGVAADNSTDDTAALQAAIDYVNSSYLGGTFGGEAGNVILPRGLVKYSGVTIKKGVNLIGAGQGNTVLLLDTDGGTGLKTPAKASQLAADAVSQSLIKGITFGVHSSLTPSTTTILLDSSGMTRCTFEDLAFVCPTNVIGCDNTGNTLAGSGGPAHWYNTWIKPFFDTSGGTGIRWGENDSSSGEQVTKQDFLGGRIGGTSGTGIHVRGGTGISFFGTTFEGLNSGSNNTIILGDTSGARTTTSVNMIGHYFEQVKITYNTNTNRCMRLNGLEVNVTEVNNGTKCGRIDFDQFYHGWPRTYVSGRVTTPTTINKSYGVDTGTGITKIGTGIYQIPFSSAMADTNYVVNGQAESGNISCRTSTKTSTSVRLLFFDDTGAAADPTSFTFEVKDV